MAMQPQRINAFRRAMFSLATLTISIGLTGCDEDLLKLVDEVLDSGCLDDKKCGDQHGTTGNVESSSDCSNGDSTDQTRPAPVCTDGESQVVACGRCGEQAQVCSDGQWIGEGDCENQKMCNPGEVMFTTYTPKFECGVHQKFLVCNDECYPDEHPEYPTRFVTHCEESECCVGGTRGGCGKPEEHEDCRPLDGVWRMDEWGKYAASLNNGRGNLWDETMGRR